MIISLAILAGCKTAGVSFAGVDVLDRVKEDMEPVAKVESFAKMEGRQMTMLVAPK